MTCQQLIDKYNTLTKKGFETILINQVIIDLRTIQLGRVRKFIKTGKIEEHLL